VPGSGNFENWPEGGLGSQSHLSDDDATHAFNLGYHYSRKLFTLELSLKRLKTGEEKNIYSSLSHRKKAHWPSIQSSRFAVRVLKVLPPRNLIRECTDLRNALLHALLQLLRDAVCCEKDWSGVGGSKCEKMR
jgi:hypothetical protein